MQRPLSREPQVTAVAICAILIRMRWKKPVYAALAIVAALFLVWRFIRPLNIFVVDERFERPLQVETPAGLASLRAADCGTCHQAIYREWSGSMHAKAWSDPYFQVDLLFDGSQQICLNCHTPLVDQQEHLVLGFRDRQKFRPILEPNPAFDPVLRDEGVTCAVCHVRNGMIVGPYGTDRAPHAVQADPAMTSGVKPCERCHVVPGDRWDTFYAVPPCGTVAEIAKSGREPDCIGCHMPAIRRSAAEDGPVRAGRRHLFMGGHVPDQVKKAVQVQYERRGKGRFTVTLTNIGASHFVPTGTPDRHLTLELRLLDARGAVLQEKVHTMKRYILWRPFIMDLWDSRLPYGIPRKINFTFDASGEPRPAALDITVRYHLLDEARRKRINYQNTEPIAYPVYRERVPLLPPTTERPPAPL